MSKQVTTTVYTFQELIDLNKDKKISNESLERARQWLREGNTDHGWWESDYETWKEALAQIGLESVEINFSGFWSQGDGASFTATVDLRKLIPFLATPIEGVNRVEGQPEDFRPWIVFKCNGVRFQEKLMRLLRLVDSYSLTLSITRDRGAHYVHENTCSVEENFDDGGKRFRRVNTRISELVEIVEQLRKDLCHAIYRDLEETYESRVSDEELLDSAEANGYTFMKNGARFG